MKCKSKLIFSLWCLISGNILKLYALAANKGGEWEREIPTGAACLSAASSHTHTASTGDNSIIYYCNNRLWDPRMMRSHGLLFILQLQVITLQKEIGPLELCLNAVSRIPKPFDPNPEIPKLWKKKTKCYLGAPSNAHEADTMTVHCHIVCTVIRDGGLLWFGPLFHLMF